MFNLSMSNKEKQTELNHRIVSTTVAMAALNIRDQNIKKGIIKDNTPKVKQHPHAKTLEVISKVLSKVEDVDNSKTDTLRLIYLFLEKDGADGYKEKDLIKYLNKPDKVKVVRKINITVTK